ncbi:MAG: PVC-type heme-binding CxxCH protein, partial [Planctomycetales bacterium]
MTDDKDVSMIVQRCLNVVGLGLAMALFTSVQLLASGAGSPAPTGVAKVASGPQHAGLSPEEAAKAMILPPGFKATLFAGEPDVKQPIAMTIDDRGRLWIAEAYSYPFKRKPGEGKDRILIFEDTNGDGKFDTRKVFIEKLNLVSGLEVGFGGVWVGQAPEFLFIPDKDGDDVPDSAPVTLLDGWGYQDTHETLNSFIWGPDGWLYGCHGVFTHSRVGKPGTPDDKRIPVNAAIWRYHPTRHEFETFCNGTSNPWGVDFNDQGQCFLTCCVIPHLFHVIQGARYHRQGGQHFNPYTYDDIKTIAVHRHWVGNQWYNPDRAQSDSVGGGHAHAGAMIYLGNVWPEKYRNQIIMNNIHGSRLNMDLLTAKGSGYVGNAAPDFLFANDKWSQMLYLRYGPDGQAYVIDWYDQNECHHHKDEGHDRNNGRIFKISYGETKSVQVDLKKLSSAELVELQLNRNDWYVRQARRILQERGPNPEVHEQLRVMARNQEDETRRLRALWALHVTGGLTDELILEKLSDRSPYIRGWMLQLAGEMFSPSEGVLKKAEELAAQDPSAIVRLYLTSLAQRLPLERRWGLVERLAKHGEDAGDHNLPLMNWYALEPLVPVDRERAVAIAMSSPISILRQYALRRIGAEGTSDSLNFLVRALGKADNDGDRMLVIQALQQALQGRKDVPMPADWKSVASNLASNPNAGLVVAVQTVSLGFGDPEARIALQNWVHDTKADAGLRRIALQTLQQNRNAEFPALLRGLLNDATLRGEALRGLAAAEDSQTPPAILGVYASLHADEKRDALNTLASRSSYAKALVAAVEQQKVPKGDLTADLIRQMVNLKDSELDSRLQSIWGVVRTTPADKQRLIARFSKAIQEKDWSHPADINKGLALFQKTCAQCHRLFDTGGNIGPELTGSNRANADYLVSNVIDPSAVMAKEYQPLIVVTKDGRTATGLLKEQTPQVIKLQTANELVTIPRAEIEEQKLSEQSMMPDNLWQNLTTHDVQSLAAYLASPQQVPMLATPENATEFFNGKDLAGWTGLPELWRVENGEIVGHTPTGIRRNQFLRSRLTVRDFELTFKVKLVPHGENSGIQFRSIELPEGEMKGYQADIGPGYWGKIYEEHARGLLSKTDGDKLVTPEEWNDYRIRAVGPRIQTWLNGQACTDIEDPVGRTRGIIALQIHSG